jgi:very-short-patch-repair endonuclease
VEGARDAAIPGKAEFAPQLFSVRRAEVRFGGKAGGGIRVFSVLQLEGEGEAALARIATAQSGNVYRRQLNAIGFGRSVIARRVSDGRLTPRFPGVFAVAYMRSDLMARSVAALLYAGDDSVISHRSGAALWGFASPPEHVDLTRQGSYVHPQPRLCARRVSALDIRDVRMHRGLPVTAPARCLLDLAADADDDEIESALAEARMRRLVSDADLEGTLARAPNRPGARRLARVMRGVSGTVITRSKAERLMLRLIADAELPMPEVNAKLLGFEVDFLWRAQNLVLEFDGFEFHRHRHQFEADRHRVQVLTAAGYRVIQVTWRQLGEEPMALAVRIGQALVRE